MNLWDILILLAVAGAVILGLVRARGRRRSGGSCCSCGCGSCDCCGNKPGSPAKTGPKTVRTSGDSTVTETEDEQSR